MMFVLSQIKNFLTSYQQLFLRSSYFYRMSSSLGRLNFFLVGRYFLLVAFGSLLFARFLWLVARICQPIAPSFLIISLSFSLQLCSLYSDKFQSDVTFCAVTIWKNVMMIRNYFIFINSAQTDDISNHNYLSKGISAP